MKNYQYNIYCPGGNDTALVNTLVTGRCLRKKINDQIMKINPSVEQVGFVSKKQNRYSLVMAGNEFCGNATRAAAYYFLFGNPGQIKISVSGASKLLEAGVNSTNQVWAKMPIFSSLKCASKINNYWLVKMQGISHVIISRQQLFSNQKLAKTEARKILTKLDLLNKYPASGVMFVNKNRGITSLEPVVWVRDIKTFFYETACGSGTTALGIYEAVISGKPYNQPVIQPSGMKIEVTVKLGKNKIKSASINGPIKVLKKDQVIAI